MTPTIEEVKRVAEDIISSDGEFIPMVDYYTASATELQAFAQHYIEVGETKQRESDAKLLLDRQGTVSKFATMSSCATHNSALRDAAEAIRNNTGE